MTDPRAAAVLPRESDLPGTGWLAIDEGVGSDAPPGSTPGELLDCVGPDFPEDEAVLLVDQCHAQGVRVRIAPSTMELLIHRAEFVAGEAVPLRGRGGRCRPRGGDGRGHRATAACLPFSCAMSAS